MIVFYKFMEFFSLIFGFKEWTANSGIDRRFEQKIVSQITAKFFYMQIKLKI
jgi:hypothetical protein